METGSVAVVRTRPPVVISTHLVALVPWSIARTRGSATCLDHLASPVGDRRGAQPEVVEQEGGVAGRGELPIDAEDAHRNGTVRLHDDAGDRGAEATGGRCLLHGDHRTGLGG